MPAPASHSTTAEWRPLAALGDIAGAWHALSAHAAEPNVFYDPSFFRAAAGVFGRDAGVIAVRRNDEKLIGLFPARIDKYRHGGLGAVLSGFVHPYGPLGTPLIDRSHADEAIAAWIDFLAGEQSMPSIVQLPFIPDGGPFATALERVLAKKGLPGRLFNRHERAFLRPAAGQRSHYLEAALSTRTRKELGRQRRRLEERGKLEYRVTEDRDEVMAALEQFLALEAKGWKGRIGTAAAQHDDIRTFMQEAVESLAREGKARCDMLAVGNRAVAVAVILRAGSAAWLWKIAYDEEVARFSPGVQLALGATSSLLADESIVQTDSCATPDHPMIDRLWSERLALSDHLISVRPDRRFSFALAGTLESLRGIAAGTARKIAAVNRRRHVKQARATPGE